jgi:hypothetical protein
MTFTVNTWLAGRAGFEHSQIDPRAKEGRCVHVTTRRRTLVASNENIVYRSRGYQVICDGLV